MVTSAGPTEECVSFDAQAQRVIPMSAQYNAVGIHAKGPNGAVLIMADYRLEFAERRGKNLGMLAQFINLAVNV